MGAVCIVGFPVELLRKLTAEATRNETEVVVVIAKLGRQGGYRLAPQEQDAIYQLSSYLDPLANYTDARVIVTPYAPLPEDLEKELNSIVLLGKRGG